jgi:uncharacterized membrane protein
MPVALVDRLRLTFRLLMAVFYVAAGVLHLTAADRFLPIMPPLIPAPRDIILFTGACEIAGGIGLLARPTRKLAGLMLAIYAICVWPANIYQALWHVSVPPLPDSWWYHGPRLAFQPVLAWWALFAGGLLSWPFRNGRSTA